MKDETIKITSNVKIKPVKPINDSFTLCKCYVMAVGKNAKNTIISKKAIDDALPTLFNVPVVGHLYVDGDGVICLGGHDLVLEKGEDGKYKFKAITVPYGTVPQQDNLHYEEAEEPDGTKNTYLVADIILWTGRYPELLDAIYNEDIYFAQSMEIIPSDTKKTDAGLEFKKFQFSALCLLCKSDDKAKNVTPCFKSARVEPYKFSESENWTELFAEFKDQLAKSYTAIDAVKGGKKALNTETIKNILLEFGLNEDTSLSFDISEGMTEDELKTEIEKNYFQDNKEFQSAQKKEFTAVDQGTSAITVIEPTQAELFSVTGGETGKEIPPAEPLKFSVDLTYEERRKALAEALEAHSGHSDKSYTWYYLVDFDDVYVYSWAHYAATNAAEEKGSIRIPYSFTDGKAVLDMVSSEKVRLVWLTKADEDKISAESAQLADLTQYKANRIEDDKKKCYTAVISEFSELGEIGDYKTVVKEAMTFESVEALTEKLYAIRGKHAGDIVKKPLDQIRIPVTFEENSKQSEYDEFMARYLTSNKK